MAKRRLFIPKIFTEHIAMLFALQNFFSFRIIEVCTLFHVLTQMKKSYMFLIKTQKLLSIYNGPKRVIQIKQKNGKSLNKHRKNSMTMQNLYLQHVKVPYLNLPILYASTCITILHTRPINNS